MREIYKGERERERETEQYSNHPKCSILIPN